MSAKRRLQLVRTVQPLVDTVGPNTTRYGPYKVLNFDVLSISQGHPFWSSSSRRKRHFKPYVKVKVPVFKVKKPPKPRKPYLGKHPKPLPPRKPKAHRVHWKIVKVPVDVSWANRQVDLFNAERMGGPFQVQHVEYTSLPAYTHAEFSSAGVPYKTDGWIRAWPITELPVVNDLLAPSSAATLQALGAKAIAKATPTSPQAGIGQFIAELRDPIVNVNKDGWKAALKQFKDKPIQTGSGHFLSYQFGFKPFVKDVNDFLDVAHSINKRIKQLDRDSGRRVRRRVKLIDTSVTTTSILSSSWGGSPALTSVHYTKLGVLTKTVTTTQKVWFSGCFTYYIPPPSDKFFEQAARIEALGHALFGLRVDASLLWQIAPWSWFGDWFANIGAIYANYAAFNHDNLVMLYGYVMETKTETTTYSCTGLEFRGSTQGPLNFSETITKTVKSRQKASPYGFGLTWDNFTPRQVAILAALGLNRI